MEKKLTAMQELKKYVLDQRYLAHVNCLDERKTAYNDVINSIESLIPKEREQIEEGFYQGLQKGDLLSRSTPPTASDYFTQTYKQ